MSGVKHTRGPWKIDFGYPRGNPCGISAKSDGRTVTRFGAFARPSTREAFANARLIAAAPDLLSVAKLALKTILDEAEARDFDPPADTNLVAELEASITRATGDRPEKGGAL